MCHHTFHDCGEPVELHREHYSDCCPHHAKPWRLGHIPLRGLLHLLILKILSKEPMRGVDIRSKIKDEVELEVPASAIYTILGLLENKGLVASTWQVEEKGPARKLYRITEEGLDYLNDAVSRIKEYKRIIDYLSQ
jgi:DNA-binding PadR family transcriptional regulator